MRGYVAAYVHSFCTLFCVERHVDMWRKIVRKIMQECTNSRVFWWPGRLNFERWRLIFWGPQCGTCDNKQSNGAKLHELLKKKSFSKNESLLWEFYLRISGSDNIKRDGLKKTTNLHIWILERGHNIMYCNPPYFESTSVPFIHYCKEQPVRPFKHFRAKLFW
jgi:hypothetical protein